MDQDSKEPVKPESGASAAWEIAKVWLLAVGGWLLFYGGAHIFTDFFGK